MPKITAYDKFMQMALKYGWLPPAPIVYEFGIPKTGQTATFRTGDDGDLEKGYPETPPRLTDNGDGTITDNGTGLMWVKDHTGAGAHGGVDQKWPHLLDFCVALDFAGHTDWRMPNVKEMLSIMDFGCVAPAMDPLFTHLSGANFWTSTTFIDWDAAALLVSINEGTISYDDKETYNYIKPVRLGRPA
jgi:hypothetical protein